MLATGCTGLDALNPICQAGSLGGSLASSGFQDALNDISQWVASGAEWLLAQIGDVLVSTTTVDVGATWFRTHYGTMTALAGVVILPLLLLSVLQAVLRQNPGQLVRMVLVQLPLALVLSGVAIQVVILSLSATDAMSDAVAGGTGADVTTLLAGVTSGLVTAAADPGLASFVLLLLALLIAVAAFVLWLELLIRAAAVYVAVLFMPLALATLVWPAVSHWCRRLVETLAALILSKFVIVAVLSLAAGAVSSGTAGDGSHGSGFSSVLAGGALLVMATFVPFAILRLIPVMEAGAVGHLDGLRSRATGAMTRLPRTAAQHALSSGLEAVGGAAQLAKARAGGALGAGGEGGDGASRAFAALSGSGEDGMDDGHKELGSDIVGINGETRDELDAQATKENGGLIPRADGVGVGLPSSREMAEDFESGRRTPEPLPPKGPKPIVGGKPDGQVEGDGGGVGDLPGSWGTDRRGNRHWYGATSQEDAWKWQGVPEGYNLLKPIEPGRQRHCFGKDAGGGPNLRVLPPVWPPGEGPNDGGAGA